MKKYILFFAIFTFGTFISSASLVGAMGSECNAQGYSDITGQRCFTTSAIYLTIGSKGSDVIAVQKMLKKQGYYFGKIDGSYGKKTARAVKDFQGDNFLSKTGTVNAQLRQLLKDGGTLPAPVPIVPLIIPSPTPSAMVPPSVVSSVPSDDFTTCLKDKGVIFYGAFWCPHCQAQKKIFGSSEKLLPYVECSTADGSAQIQSCKDKNITVYPTWEFSDGSRSSGELTLKQLADKTSCTLPQ